MWLEEGILSVSYSKAPRDKRAIETLDLHQELESPVNGVEVAQEVPIRRLLPS